MTYLCAEKADAESKKRKGGKPSSVRGHEEAADRKQGLGAFKKKA